MHLLGNSSRSSLCCLRVSRSAWSKTRSPPPTQARSPQVSRKLQSLGIIQLVSVGPRHVRWRGPRPGSFSILSCGIYSKTTHMSYEQITSYRNFSISLAGSLRKHNASQSSLGSWPCKHSCKSERRSFSSRSLGRSGRELDPSLICMDTSNLYTGKVWCRKSVEVSDVGSHAVALWKSNSP